MNYDAWKCAPPDERDEPTPLDQAERDLDDAHDELARMHRQVEELEIELAAAQGNACERMTYGELYRAVAALLPLTSFVVGVETTRYAQPGQPVGSPKTRWQVTWWLDDSKAGSSTYVQSATAEAALDALKLALAPTSATDPTGVDALVRDADVGF